MKPQKIAMYILGALIAVCFFGLTGILIFKGVPEQNSDVFYLIVGAIIGYMASVVQYFFGSSAGSAEKTDMMNKNNPNNPTPQV